MYLPIPENHITFPQCPFKLKKSTFSTCTQVKFVLQ